jgi:hypothetical protein
MMLSKLAKISIMVVMLLLGFFLISVDRGFSQPWRTVLPFVYAALSGFMAKKLTASSSDQLGAQEIVGRFKFKELIKFGCCIIALFAWLMITIPLLDTLIGAAVVLVPCFLLLAAALFFFSRSY